jgi:hypothetical protein
MISGTGYPSGENYPAGTGMELFFYPHAGTGNPTGKILRVRVRVRMGTTRRVRTRCHLDSQVTAGMHVLLLVGNFDVHHNVNDSSCQRKMSF